MLQQTRIEQVIGYYNRFLEKLPTLKDLAEADEDTYLKLWQGLGYYSRVRNLHKTAVILTETNDGKIPDEEKELLSLPGIGSYTAHAILAIAYEKPYVALDGNFLRIYARLTEESSPIDETETKKRAESFFLSAVKKNPRYVTQGLMDLGQLTCIPNGRPLCQDCPLRESCLSHKEGKETDFPVRKEKKPKREEERYLFLFRYGDKVAIRKRPDKGLLASLYEFPNFLKEGKKPEEILKENNIDYVSLSPLCEYDHVFSHLIWKMEGYEVKLKKKPSDKSLLFVSKEEIEKYYSIPSAFQYLLNYV